ncbi:MAG: PKD domain-containing protein [Nocardioidaceae bacterium]|nr:PKD domain-containing protein [Nocardioidaceae bacterium]NUS51299.1 PKD domain-containing protein [Nocardioidaceae bacterium]
MPVRPPRFAGGTALLLALAALALPAAPASAAGTVFWVDNTAAGCTDTGTGTTTAPFCTISAAVKKAVLPGDDVRIRPGTYREQVTPGANGTATDPIRIEGDAPGVVVLGTRSLAGAATWSATATNAWSTPYAPASAPRQVLVDGSRLTQVTSATGTTPNSWFYDAAAKVLYVDVGGANPGDGHQVEAGAQSFGVSVAGRQNVVVANLETRWQNFAGVRVLSSSAVTVDGVTAAGSASNGVLVDTSSNVTVSNAEVSGALSTGIRLTGTTGSTVRGSRSHDNGLDGIGLATSSGNVLDRNETFRNVSLSPTATGVGIDVNTTSPDNTVTRNRSHDNQDSGFQVYSGSSRALVARNVSWSNGDHGFDTLNAVGATYLNNTAYGNRRDGISVEGSATGATLANNVLVDNGNATSEYDIYVDPSSVSGFSADHDLAWNSDTTPVAKVNGVVHKTMAVFSAATGFEPHGLQLAPGFVDAAGADFRLTPGSPAVDAADAGVTGFVADDAAGNAPVDDPVVPDTGDGSTTYADLGAYEQQPPAGATDYPPHAALVVDPTTVQVPPSSQVTADASGSSDVDTTGIASYRFDFGDGSAPVTQPTPVATHAYAGTGTFAVTLTVTDTQGGSDTATRSVTVTSRPVQTYYVTGSSPSCSDTGPATQAAPLCTINAGLRKALAGDTVLVGAGQYREQARLLASGEPGAPVTVRATSPDAVLLGTDDLSDTAGWSPAGPTAWQHAFSPAAPPTQVFLDGNRLTKAAGLAAMGSGSWFFDPAAGLLYVDVGGGNPASGHTVSAGARNFGLMLRSVSYVDVSGFSFRQQNLSGLYLDQVDHVTVDGYTTSSAGSHGTTVDGSSHVALSDVTATDDLGAGVRFFQSSDSSLDGGSTHHNQYHGVSVQGSQRVTVAHVTSYANKRVGTRVATGIDVSSSSVDTLVEDNTVYGNDDSGIEAYTGATGTVIRRNLSYDNNDHGIDNSAAPGSVVVSNTVVGNATAGINFEGGSDHPVTRDNVTMDNAVGSTRTIGEIRLDETSAPGADLNRDLVFQSNGGPLFEWASQPYGTLAAFRGASGQETDGLSANPRFAGLAARDLRLTSESPAIDAAFTQLAAWAAKDRVGASPVDDPAVADTGTGPDAVADLGALEYRGPVAAGTVSPRTGLAPLSVTVDGTPTLALGADVTGYRWTCGNGSTVTTATGTCSYATPGTYAVQLTATDASGLTSTWSTTVTAVKDAPPTVSLAATPATAYVPQDVVLDAGGTTDDDGTPVASYAFTCGNGTGSGTRTTATYTCSYPKAGTYTAAVLARDTAGLSATRTLTVRILADVAPNAAVTATPGTITRGQSVTVSAAGSTSVDKSPIATYRFDCGNGTVTAAQTSPTTSCSYPSTGNFTVRVTVTDTVGLSSSATTKVLVKK